MFKSNISKAVVVLLVILGFMQLTAKQTTDVMEQNAINNDFEQQAKQRYQQRLKDHQANKMAGTSSLNEQRDMHHFLIKLSSPINSVKTAVSLYKRKHDKWPEDMTDLGLKSEKAADGSYTESIKVHNGEVYAFLTKKYGHEKMVRLYSNDGYSWKCTTNLELPKNKKIASAPCTMDKFISFSGRHFQ